MGRSLLALPLLLLLTAPAPAQDLDVRLVSFNVWGLPWGIAADREQRIARIGPALARLHPDLVALQEVWLPEDGRLISGALAEAGLIHAHHAVEGFLGTGLLIASRWPLEDLSVHTFRFGGKPHKPYHGDWWARKGLLRVRVSTPAGPLLLADTHLHATYGTLEYLPTQVTQALQAADWLGDHGARPPPRADDGARPPLVLAGDINSRREDLPFRLLTSRAGLHPPRAKLDIDWVLTRDGGAQRVEVRRVEHVLTEDVDLGAGVRAPLSDHPAVLAQLRLRRGPPADWRPEVERATWRATAHETLPVLEAQLSSAAADASAGRSRAAWCILLAGVLFGLDRWRRRRGKGGCLFPLLSLALLHLAVWALYFGAVYAPYEQAGLTAACGVLTRGEAAEER